MRIGKISLRSFSIRFPLSPKVETRSEPECHGFGEAYGRQEVPDEFIVSGSVAAEVFEAPEHGLDPPAFLLAAFVMLDRSLAVAPA